ncbi:MAG: 50S ribosomal protein L22 [Candidatus Pacebacteria bacterium]|nr:50S ribosomal protein L22 [Candidatus Paceibacterota bacterium]
MILAKLNNLRISPRKVRLVTDMVRGKKANNAQAVLGFCIKKGALPIKKLLDSAIANAKNNFKLDEKDLFIALAKVDEGRTLKRWRARARGRACRIEKKTSNITLGLDIFKDKTITKEMIEKEEEKPQKKIKIEKVKKTKIKKS